MEVQLVCHRFGDCGAHRIGRHAAELPPFSGRSRRSHPLNGARDAIEQFLWRTLAMLAPPNCSMERNPLRSAPLRRGCAFGAPSLGGSGVRSSRAPLGRPTLVLAAYLTKSQRKHL